MFVLGKSVVKDSVKSTGKGGTGKGGTGKGGTGKGGTGKTAAGTGPRGASALFGSIDFPLKRPVGPHGQVTAVSSGSYSSVVTLPKGSV